LRQVGDIVERFELLSLLGKSGSATLWLARHLQLSTHHAIRFLSAPNPRLKERLLREGRIQILLKHPNVVAVTDVVQSNGEIGFVMEFVQGFSLSDCIHDDGAMELQEALVLFSQILGGVGTAHAAGILHRDIKPAKVLLTSQGDTVIAKVADFGIAKFGQPSQETLGGTPMVSDYMAPEQITDSATFTRRADIFALGALLYELVGGKPAFPGTDLRGILNDTAAGVFTPLSVHAPSTPRRIIEGVERALDPDTQARFDDVEGFAHALGIPVNIAPPPEGVEFVPPGEAPPVRNTTMLPVVELAPDEEDTPVRGEMPPPDSRSTSSQPPLRQAPPSVWEHGSMTPGRTRVRRTSQSSPDYEDARDSMSVEDRYGLSDPNIELLSQETLTLSKDTQDTEHSGQDDSRADATEPQADDWMRDYLWPTLTVLGNTIRYLAVPVLLMVGIGYLGGLKGQDAVQGASRAYESAEDQLAQAVLSQEEMATELAAISARGPALQALVKATETGDPQLRFVASKQLSDAMLDELRMLPPNTDPAEELKRRSLELQIQDLGRAHERHAKALGQWQQASEKVTGNMAILLRMAPSPPKLKP
jgi:serine/threonine protein kinase